MTPTSPHQNARGKHIVILGGGFAGLRTALWLARHMNHREGTITLIDQADAHVNPTWLYEVATAFNPFEREAVGQVLHASASVPFVQILHGSGVVFLRRKVERIDPAKRVVEFGGGESLASDILVVALGSQIATFKIPGVETHAFSIKTLPEAAELRHHIVGQFLRHRSASRVRQERAFRIAVVGGGAAGVEFAAEAARFLRKLSRLHDVHREVPEVHLFEASGDILREYPPALQKKGVARLKALGVRLHPKESACAVGSDHLTSGSGTFLPTDTVVWLAGIRTHELLMRSGFAVHPRGGVQVERSLQVLGFPQIFAAGDCVCILDPATGKTVPDVAYAAIQQGRVVGQNILRLLRGQPLLSYIDRPRPTLATVGGKYALVHMPPLQFAGRFGWIVKQFTDLCYLFSILPNDVAFRAWVKGVRVRIAND